MEKDELKNLFDQHKELFQQEETPAGHEHRFFEKINAAPTKKSRPMLWLSIAASFLILMGVGFNTLYSANTVDGLASVSPQMKETQSFFTTTINTELEKLKKNTDPSSKKLINDALRQLEKLEQEYTILKQDLIESGNNKRVIAAMIENFQNRIDILTTVSNQIEAFKNINTNTNENIL